MKPEVPQLARALVRLFSAREDRPFICEDLGERFLAIAEESGAGAARRWYWSQAVRAISAAAVPDLDLLNRRSWQGLIGDIRQSLRVLRRKPLYTAGVTGTLAIGLASAAAVLSVAWHVWLAPMPFPDPERVVRLLEVEPLAAGSAEVERTRWRLSPPFLEDLRAYDWTTVSAVAGVSRNVLDWRREEGTSRITALVVSPELFEILGIAPLFGRALSFDEDAPEVVLSEAFWRRVFGADPGVVGSGSLMLSGESHRIVGVVRLPSGYPDDAELIVRMSFGPDQLVLGMRGARYIDVVARVAPTHSVDDATAEMNRVVLSFGERFAHHRGWGGEAVSLTEELMRPYRGVMGLLLAAGCVFLLLAVVNVAGLVAARTVDGRHDRGIRLALGASERRLMRGSLVEAVLVGAMAGGFALLVAYGLLIPLAALVPSDVPRAGDVRLSAGVGGAILALALLSGWLVGLLGYLLSRGVAPAIGRSATGIGTGLAGRSALVASQVALTTLLATTGAGVIRHVVTLQGVDLGFEAQGVASAEIMARGERYPTPESRAIYWRVLLQNLQARGLDVAIATSPPMAGVNMPWGFRIEPTDEQRFAQYDIVSADYFDVMGIEVIEGRVFTEEDRVGNVPVIVIDEASSILREQNVELERISMTDALTSLFNRRYVMQEFDKEIHRASRHERKFAVLMMDVDRFKQYNDSFGHPAGDQVLMGMGRVVREATREPDIPARYGGEEFIVLLPDCDLQGAVDAAERIRTRLAKEVFDGRQVTVSIGASEYPTHGASAKDLIAAADVALYEAKESGRDRVMAAGQPAPKTDAPADEAKKESPAARRKAAPKKK
ncbi:MAG: diguanylate cyclase [Gemmatimonadetes bacterium]|nr:diguanylate cyclase [Gemmatimonadota bacterium]MDA1103359.1 diguanylate cyclase [Gemmatimonadota bacterium]